MLPEVRLRQFAAENTQGDVLSARMAVEYAMEFERLRKALGEIYAVVRGESPRLLDEDSGGSAELALEIEALLAD